MQFLIVLREIEWIDSDGKLSLSLSLIIQLTVNYIILLIATFAFHACDHFIPH